MKELLVIPYWEDFHDIFAKTRPAQLCVKPRDFELSHDGVRNIALANSIEQLEELIESNDYNITINFGFHIRPQLDYETENKLFLIVERISKCKNFNKVKWRFANGWDIYNLDEEARLVWFLEQTKLIDQKNIIMHLNNDVVVKDYKKVLPDADIQFYNVYYNRIHLNNEKLNFQPSTNKRQKHCVSFNGRICWHRDQIVNHIESNYKDKCYYSYIEKNISLGTQITEDTDTGPKPDIEMFDRNFEDWMLKPSYSILNDSYAHFVTETFFDPNSIAVAFNGIDPDGNTDVNIKPIGNPNGLITEKIYKTFLFEQPLLIVAFPHTLKLLKEIGFESFPEFFNEDYDAEEHHHIRLQKVINSLDEFMKMDINDVHELYHSNSVQEKLKYNKKLFLKNCYESPINKWFVPNKQYQLS